LTTAFSNDPITHWFIRDADTYLTFWPRIVAAMAGKAFDSGTADSVADHCGVALWLGPGVESDEEAMGDLIGEAIARADQEDVFAFMTQMGEFHPTYTHWYLPLIGVDLPHQGRGYGSALLVHSLRLCDADRLPAYLEATNPRNKLLYERHGFEEQGIIQAGGSPPMWPMLRQPVATSNRNAVNRQSST
jgi:ribosomal protein S18 acetylase RimI-like enzyme